MSLSAGIPGLYIPTTQLITMIIFGSPHEGVLDPESRDEYISKSLYSELQVRWPSDYPTSVVPLQAPCHAAGPVSLMVRKIEKKESRFLLGSRAYGILCQSASMGIHGEIACGVQHKLEYCDLTFLCSSLEARGFRTAKSSVRSSFKYSPLLTIPRTYKVFNLVRESNI